MGSEVEKWKQQERGEISITNKSEFLSKNFSLRFTGKKPKTCKSFYNNAGSPPSQQLASSIAKRDSLSLSLSPPC